MQAGLETFNQQPCAPESCHSVALAKVLLFIKAAQFSYRTHPLRTKGGLRDFNRLKGGGPWGPLLDPPCVPLYHCLHSTSLFKLPPPAFHSTFVSILLLYLNFLPCVPLNHCLHSTSLFKLPPPLRSNQPLSPFYFFI